MKRTIFLLFIVGLAFFLRIYKVTTIPPALSWDEVSIGYNAYSILKTGYDEHHRYFPLDAFAAYGDYKPPLAIYLTVPFVAIFGLGELAVRLPSVVAGTLTVLCFYLLVHQLFNQKKEYVFTIGSLQVDVPMVAALLLALSPWHIQLSRAGFEANIALCFIVIGVLCMFRSLTRPKYLYVCILPFIFAVYTFNSARYFGPLLLVGLVVYMRKYIASHKREILIGCIISLVVLLPILPHLFSKQARLRFDEVNIFSDASIVKRSNMLVEDDDNVWWSTILHNRRIGYVRSYLLHFFDNVEPWFLFIRGDGNPKFSLGDVGQLYIIEAPFLVLGIFWLLKDRKATGLFFLYWIIAAIIPAATARETPHALRIENSLPAWLLFISYGLVSSVKTQLSEKKRVFAVLAIALLYCGNFLYFWHNYMNHYPSQYSGEWQWGYREAIGAIAPIKQSYKEVVMSEVIGRPYMYVLFYEKIDPRSVQIFIDGSFDDAGFYNVRAFDSYSFVRERPQFHSNVLYVLPPSDMPQNAHLIQTIHLLNGEPVLVIFDI